MQQHPETRRHRPLPIATFTWLAFAWSGIVGWSPTERSESPARDGVASDGLREELEGMGAQVTLDRGGRIAKVVLDGVRASRDVFTLLLRTSPTSLEIHNGAQLTDSELCEIAGLTSLRTLLLESCPRIGADGYRSLCKLPALVKLTIVSQHLPEEAWESLARCTNLETLYLVDISGVSPRGLQWLDRLRKLHSLALVNLPLSRASVESVAAASSLEFLDMHESQFADKALRPLVSLRGLKAINLARTTVNDSVLETLAQLPSLEVAMLNETAISDESFKEWCPAESLRTVTLKNTAVGPNAVAEFRSKHRGCSVEQ